ncbi:hypothetical protein [Streptomyces sp. NPDC088725]
MVLWPPLVGFIDQLIFSREQGALRAILGGMGIPTDRLGDPDLNTEWRC